MSVQDLARSLAAVGSLKLPEDEGEGLYLLDVREGDLIEKLWMGDTLRSENVVASDVSNNTAASYLLGFEGDARLIILTDEHNAIQCYSFNIEIEEWEQTPLGSKWNITTSPNSKLSTTLDPENQIVISYQDQEGNLAGIMSVAGGTWKPLGRLGGDPVNGTPQRLEVIDGKLHLFYVGTVGCICYLVLEPGMGTWQANMLGSTKFDTAIDNFYIVKDPETGSFQSYLLSAGSLWIIDGDKEKARLGKVENTGKLIPSDNAQAGCWLKWIKWSRPRKVVITSKKMVVWF